MLKEKILVVEDDLPIRIGLVDLLSAEGYDVASAADGAEALRAYEAEKPTLILLDIMLPEMSGYDVCRGIRQRDPLTPILMLTAKGQEVDKVIGLELGADDYIVKPFGVNELIARVRAALRRSHAKSDEPNHTPILFGDVRVDPKTFVGTKGGKEFPVTQREIQLLQLFMEHDGEVLDRLTLLERVWGVRYAGTTRTLDQHIAKLRQKIEAIPSEPKHITTVHGVGYRFRSEGD